MNNDTISKKIDAALETRAGLNTGLIIGAIIHASIFGSLCGFCIFILTFYFEASSVLRVVLLFVSLCAGWLCVFIASYCFGRLEFKDDFKRIAQRHETRE